MISWSSVSRTCGSARRASTIRAPQRLLGLGVRVGEGWPGRRRRPSGGGSPRRAAPGRAGRRSRTVSPKRSSSCGRSSPSSGFMVPISTIREAWLTETPSRSTVERPGGGGVEQQVDEMIMQQVDLVDVEDAAVGGGEQAGLVGHLAGCPGPACRSRAPITRSSLAPDRQLDQPGRTRRWTRPCRAAVRAGRVGVGRVAAEPAALDDREVGEHVGQRPDHGGLGRALLAADQDAADLGGRPWSGSGRGPGRRSRRWRRTGRYARHSPCRHLTLLRVSTPAATDCGRATRQTS